MLDDTEKPFPTIVELTTSAIEAFASALDLEVVDTLESHTVLHVNNADDVRISEALAVYLVAWVAGAIELDARVSGAMLVSGSNARQEIVSAVERLVGKHNLFASEAEEQFRDTVRNAWIAEGFGHMLFATRKHYSSQLLPGHIHAISALHVIPSEPGLDAVVLYEDAGNLVLGIGESKASRRNGSKMLAEAAGLYRRIDSSEYGVELRTNLTTFRGVVPDDVRGRISDAVWRDSRSYFPQIVHESGFDPTSRRPVLEMLTPGKTEKRLASVRLDRFHQFFDRVADAMRKTVDMMWPADV